MIRYICASFNRKQRGNKHEKCTNNSKPINRYKRYKMAKDVCFKGDSRKSLEDFPYKIREQFVQAIEAIRYGLNPPLTLKPMNSLGKGVVEIKKNGKPAYRVVYVIKDDTLYILHAYSKTSNGTDKKHKDTISARHKQL